MIDILIALSVNTLSPKLPTTKRGWQEHLKVMCNDSNVGKTEAAIEYFNRCFPAKIEYLEWLRKNHPRDYIEFERKQDEETRSILRGD